MKRSLATTLALVLMAAACGESAVTSTTAAPTTSGVSTAPSTTTVNSTTTSPNRTTAPTIPEPLEPGWMVIGVADNDVLNVRAAASASSPKIAELGPHAVGVATTGLGTSSHLTPGWWEVPLDEGGTGWVNSRYLALSPLWTVPFATTPCSTGVSNTSPPTISSADHVMALDYLKSEECDRFVVLLGERGALGPPDWPMTPADAVPEGVEVTVLGSVVAIHLPTSVDGVRPMATERAFGSGTAFVVRAGGGGRDLDVNLHFDRNKSAHAFFLSDPARIVIDLTDAPTGTGLDLAPLMGALTVLSHRINVDVDAPASLPIIITGYSRPFEAQGAVELRTTAATPGGGTPVVASWDGDFGPRQAAAYSYMTTDYAETWGSFSFELVDVDPGTYELFVGEFSAKDGAPLGVYDQITVG